LARAHYKSEEDAKALHARRDAELAELDGDYETRVRALEGEGLTRSDAQGVVDAQGAVEPSHNAETLHYQA
jgi:hypothetical protein